MLRRLRAIAREDGLVGLAQRVAGRINRWVGSNSQEFSARQHGSYGQPANPLRLHPRLHGLLQGAITEADCISAGVTGYYLNHRFDLFGSGWVQVRYGMECRGLDGHCYAMDAAVVPDAKGEWLHGRINSANLAYAQAVWCRIDAGYLPIDWQLDFKSGFRWSEAEWAKRLKYAHLPGVDVKVPWELARMQHLPQLALRAMALKQHTAERQQLVREIRNQIFDFIATNPPGFGVNWLCPMDVAIRAANWLLAWDILCAAGLALDGDDEVILADSVHSHGRFIVANLEWSPQRGNHYLSHICGVAFIAAYLPESKETNDWLAFAVGQLISETLRQFHPDGGNFEGSVAYHRLSSEMVLYTTAVILGLPEARLHNVAAIDVLNLRYLPRAAKIEPATRWELQPTAQDGQGQAVESAFNSAYLERLRALVDFFEGVMKSDGTFPQIGDNDSGRFFKVQPIYVEMQVCDAKCSYANLAGYSDLPDSAAYYFEDTLLGSHLLNAASALGWGSDSYLRGEGQEGVDQLVVAALAGAKILPGFKQTLMRSSVLANSVWGTDEAFLRLWGEVQQDNPQESIKTFELPGADHEDLQPITLRYFKDFGCFVFKHPAFYLAVRCLIRPEQKTGGHFHADQLSIALDIAGIPVIRDPGTYVYTALPDERNRYRAAQSHFGPLWESAAQVKQALGVFDALTIPPAFIDYFGQQGFAARMSHMVGKLGLLIRIDARAIRILHFGVPLHSQPNEHYVEPQAYSPGYGIREVIDA